MTQHTYYCIACRRSWLSFTTHRAACIIDCLFCGGRAAR